MATTRTDKSGDIRRLLEQSQHAARLQAAALIEVQAACMMNDPKTAEDARIRAVAHFDAYLDHYMAAHRIIHEL